MKAEMSGYLQQIESDAVGRSTSDAVHRFRETVQAGVVLVSHNTEIAECLALVIERYPDVFSMVEEARDRHLQILGQTLLGLSRAVQRLFKRTQVHL